MSSMRSYSHTEFNFRHVCVKNSHLSIPPHYILLILTLWSHPVSVLLFRPDSMHTGILVNTYQHCPEHNKVEPRRSFPGKLSKLISGVLRSGKLLLLNQLDVVKFNHFMYTASIWVTLRNDSNTLDKMLMYLNHPKNPKSGNNAIIQTHYFLEKLTIQS